MPSIQVDDIEKTLSKYGQDHLLKFYPRLTPEQRAALISDIESIDFQSLMTAFEETNASHHDNSAKLDELLQPIPDELHEGVSRSPVELINEYRDTGLREIANGTVAALLLAGGQGTRLQVSYPKGMYDVGLPSHKTLYQLQAERILKLEELSFQLTGKRGSIPWYIMTSEHTMMQTLEFFAENNYFGLKKENLVVFEQYMQPCLSFDGKIIMETPGKIAKAPDGNGGLFRALKDRAVLDDLMKRGIRYVHVYCVDNILVKVADPVFIGYCIRKNANCAAKVVEKVSPTESVGIVCRVKGKFQVVEYSEISELTMKQRNEDGRLTFNAGNICNHFFTTNFLRQVGGGEKLRFHIAKKKIPHVDDEGNTLKPLKPNGVKLEKFIFDCFPYSDSFAAWEVLRDEEFSPMKNADDCNKDTPTTARNALYALHRKFVEAAGGRFDESACKTKAHTEESGVCEISPLVSYDGEGLKDIVGGKMLSFPVVILSTEEQKTYVKNGHRED